MLRDPAVARCSLEPEFSVRGFAVALERGDALAQFDRIREPMVHLDEIGQEKVNNHAISVESTGSVGAWHRRRDRLV